MKTSYYIGVLLSASTNPLNKIEFFASTRRDGKVALYSRNKEFTSRPVPSHLDKVGVFSSIKSVVNILNDSRQTMADNGLSVPGVKLYKL